jgi:hypothetical protein
MSSSLYIHIRARTHTHTHTLTHTHTHTHTQYSSVGGVELEHDTGGKDTSSLEKARYLEGSYADGDGQKNKNMGAAESRELVDAAGALTLLAFSSTKVQILAPVGARYSVYFLYW